MKAYSYIIFFFLISLFDVFAFKKLRSKESIEEIRFLYKQYQDIHPNPFKLHSKKEIDKDLEKLILNWGTQDSISLKNFILESKRLIASMSLGHSRVRWSHPEIIKEAKRNVFIPFTISMKDNKFYIKDVLNSYRFKGEELKLINGEKVSKLFLDCKSLFGGLEHHKDQQALDFFGIFLFLKEVEAPFNLVFKSKNSSSVNGVNVFKYQDLAYKKFHDLKPYQFEFLEGNVALISFNYYKNEKLFNNFITQSFKTIDSLGIQKLIIDISNDRGGSTWPNYQIIRHLSTSPYRELSSRYWKVSTLMKKQMKIDKSWTDFFGQGLIDKYLTAKTGELLARENIPAHKPKKPIYFFEGNTVFIIGTNTYSSGAYMANYVKTNNVAKLVGQPTGSPTNDFGEVTSFKLPKTAVSFDVCITYDIGVDEQKLLIAPVFPDVYAENENAIQKAIEILEK